jgi:hypothetical protein
MLECHACHTSNKALASNLADSHMFRPSSLIHRRTVCRVDGLSVPTRALGDGGENANTRLPGGVCARGGYHAPHLGLCCRCQEATNAVTHHESFFDTCACPFRSARSGCLLRCSRPAGGLHMPLLRESNDLCGSNQMTTSVHVHTSPENSMVTLVQSNLPSRCTLASNCECVTN